MYGTGGVSYGLLHIADVSKLFCTNTLHTAGGRGVRLAVRSKYTANQSPFDQGKSITLTIGRGGP